MKTNSIITIKNIVKKFDKKTALNDLSLEIKEGQLFSLLGLNGAGKSTLVNIISGLLKMDSGSIEIDKLLVEKNDLEIKNKIGVLFQKSLMDPLLSVQDNLLIRASSYFNDKNQIKEAFNNVVKEFKLETLLKKTYAKLSGGQQRRVNIARCLIHSPKILFLDEPTTGLDPISRKLVWDIIQKMIKEKNLTVFLTTHYMEEANNSDYVVIIDEGKVLCQGTPSELKNNFSKISLIIYTQDDYKKIYDSVSNSGLEFKTEIDKITITFENFKILNNFIAKHKTFINDYEVLKGTMDDVFINVSGKNAGNL
ncbi:ABC transporter, ATP-binding protein [Mycoplasmopsis alligatoris A21JP2]|uniref:ABC transporter, ATP-binding protein n=1 Tax=Mycoplasmopsis alligatoris A21JP2 TaxID=747682 RepID=D4XWZ3_9BACT|nr:ABC transporter, ATP-binding protein [Mycoplasmopsis alligatoris A21JP2]